MTLADICSDFAHVDSGRQKATEIDGEVTRFLFGVIDYEGTSCSYGPLTCWLLEAIAMYRRKAISIKMLRAVATAVRIHLDSEEYFVRRPGADTVTYEQYVETLRIDLSKLLKKELSPLPTHLPAVALEYLALEKEQWALASRIIENSEAVMRWYS